MNLRPRYNIAPSQPILSITSSNDGLNENYIAGYFRWGLIPGWVKDASIGTKLINARAETAHEKPSFRDAYRKKRCLIPISGFYEWNESKQPFWITSTNSGFLSLAGLWESWISSNGEEIKTCAILTTKANKDLSEIHSRMPVILSDSNIKSILINIFGGIVRCDRVAQGVIDALAQIEVKIPIIIRLEGTNAKAARKLLHNSKYNFIVAKSLAEAAEQAVHSAKQDN